MLMRIARCKAIDEMRRRGRQAQPCGEIESADDSYPCDPAVLFDLDNREAVIHAAIGQLPAPMRHVIYRRFWAGEDVSTIALALGIPANTVYTRLRRAQMRLRGLLVKFESN